MHDALVWRRVDWRESSRVVTLLTRDRGRITVFAKGCHRPGSQFAGRIDLFDHVEAMVHVRPAPSIQATGSTDDLDPPGARLLNRIRLLHEPRGLRRFRRYCAASWLAEMADPGFFTDRPDADLYDLVRGGLRLLERAPEPTLPRVCLGLELRLLAHHGVLPDLERCSEGGEPLAGSTTIYAMPRGPGAAGVSGGISCPKHRPAGARAISSEARELLHRLAHTKGTLWPTLQAPAHMHGAAGIVAGWLAEVLPHAPRFRALAYCGVAPAHAQGTARAEQGNP